MPHRDRERELGARVLVPLVVVFDDDHPVPPHRRPDGGPHSDVVSPVARHHEECDFLLLRDLAALLAFLEHLHDAREGSRPVLEKIVDIRHLVRREGVSRRHDHPAAGVEQNGHEPFDTLEELVEVDEDAAPGAGAVPGREPLRTCRERPDVNPFRFHFPLRGDLDTGQARRLLLGDGRKGDSRRIPGLAGIRAEVVIRDLDLFRLRDLDRLAQHRLGVLYEELLPPDAVDPARDHGRVPLHTLHRRLDLEGHRAAVGAVVVLPVGHHEALDILQGLADLLQGERPDDVRPDEAHLLALLAQSVHRLLGGLRRGVDDEQRGLGILHPVQVEEVVPPAGERLELGKDLPDDRMRPDDRIGLLLLVVDEIGVVHVRTDRHRLARVDGRDRRDEWTEEVLHHLRVGEDLHAPLLVGSEKPVECHHHREPDGHLLADPGRHDVHVVDRLHVGGHQDDPAGVHRQHDVAVVAADVERARHRPGDDVEHHREPRARLDRQLLESEEETVRRGGVEDPASRRGCAETDSRRPMLAVPRDHADGVLAFRLHRVERLGDLGGGGDGVVPHDVVVDMLGRGRRDLVAALDDHFLRRPRSPLFRRFGHLSSPSVLISGISVSR